MDDLAGEEHWVERLATKNTEEHEQTQGRRREIKWWNSSLKNSSSTWILDLETRVLDTRDASFPHCLET